MFRYMPNEDLKKWTQAEQTGGEAQDQLDFEFVQSAVFCALLYKTTTRCCSTAKVEPLLQQVGPALTQHSSRPE